MKSENTNTSRVKSSRAIPKKSPPGIPQSKTQKYGAKGPRASESLQGKTRSFTEMKKLAQELQNQQIKLERQNNSLRRTQVKMKKKLAEHANFYDLAPVGFLTLDEKGRIVSANQLANVLLGVEKKTVIGKKLERFFAAEDQPKFREHLRSLLRSHVKKVSEVMCLKHNHSPHIVRLQSMKERSASEESITSYRIVLIDLTKREQEKQAQQVQAEWMSGILDHAMDAIMTIDEQQRIVQFNPAAERMFHCSSRKVMGQPIEQFLPQRFRKAHQQHIRQFSQYQVTNRRMGSLGRIVGLRDDGEEFPAEASISQVVVGKKKLFTVILRDTSERDLKENALQWLSQQHQLLLDSAGEGIYSLDIQGRTILFNRAAEKMTGWDFKDVRGKFLHPLIHHAKPDGSTYHWEESRVHATLTKGISHQVEDEVLWRKDGTSFHVDYTSTPTRDAKGHVSGAVAMFRDISKRKQAEEDLRESEQRLKIMVEHLPAGAVFTDGHMLVFNKATETLTGYSRTEVTTLDAWFRLLHGHDERMVRKLYLKDKNAGFAMPRLVPIRRKDGKIRFVEFTAYGWEKGEVWLLHDVTERHEAQKALLESHRALEDIQQELQALAGKLLTAQEDERRRISRELHDDMNQRMAMLAFKIQTLQGQLTPGHDLHVPLEEIHDDVASLSDELRRLAYQLHPSILEDMGLPIALRSLADDITRREGIPITIQQDELPASLPFSHTVCLYRVCQEGLRNAVKHGCAKSATLTIKVVDGGISLCVEDTGKGFNPDNPALKQLGIGLVGMQERVRLVGGTLSIRSRPGQGTELCAWVPLPPEVT